MQGDQPSRLPEWGKITQQEMHNGPDGGLPDGTEIPVYPFNESRRTDNKLLRRYGVSMDFELYTMIKNQ